LLKKMNLKLKIQSYLKRILIEGIPVVLFIGAIHLNPLIRGSLAALRIGELINQKGATIKCNLLLT